MCWNPTNQQALPLSRSLFAVPFDSLRGLQQISTPRIDLGWLKQATLQGFIRFLERKSWPLGFGSQIPIDLGCLAGTPSWPTPVVSFAEAKQPIASEGTMPSGSLRAMRRLRSLRARQRCRRSSMVWVRFQSNKNICAQEPLQRSVKANRPPNCIVQWHPFSAFVWSVLLRMVNPKGALLLPGEWETWELRSPVD